MSQADKSDWESYKTDMRKSLVAMLKDLKRLERGEKPSRYFKRYMEETE